MKKLLFVIFLLAVSSVQAAYGGWTQFSSNPCQAVTDPYYVEDSGFVRQFQSQERWLDNDFTYNYRYPRIYPRSPQVFQDPLYETKIQIIQEQDTPCQAYSQKQIQESPCAQRQITQYEPSPCQQRLTKYVDITFDNVRPCDTVRPVQVVPITFDRAVTVKCATGSPCGSGIRNYYPNGPRIDLN